MRMPVAGLLAGLFLFLAAPAMAQTPALDAALREALAVTPTPASLRDDQANWLAERAEAGADDLAAVDDDRIERLRAVATRDRAVRAAGLSAVDLAHACLPLGLDGCRSNRGGYLRGPSGETLYWQVQEGSTEADGVSGAVVLLARDGDTLRPIAWTSGGFYETPQLIETGDPAEVYVALPGYSGGTGHYNADVVFRWRPGAATELTEIDTRSWRAALAAQLPPGLEVWKGVEFRWPMLTAQTPLWAPGDANCCATGGEATLIFAIRDGVLLLSQVGVEDVLTQLAMTVPTDVFDFVGRRAMCEHWSGEEGYDDDRRTRIAGALAELRCETLDADETALRAKYADQPRLLGLFTRPPPPPPPF